MLLKADDGTEQWVDRQMWEDRQRMKKDLLLATREEIAVGVSYARQVGALGGEPLPGKVEEWSTYSTGIVWAAMEKKGVFA
jgi:hypothetical protein